MNQHCEACERFTVEIVDPCDNAERPYQLCIECHARLHALALRPLEWYNLAKRHTWYQFLLHDDFYDEDGTATQPNNEVERPEDFPAPGLTAVKQDSALLLDYSITRWHLEPDAKAAWKSLPPQDVLQTLSAHFDATSNLEIRSTILTICASALGAHGADFVRYAWQEYPQRANLPSLAEASAACLPKEEGFDRVTASLSGITGREKRDLMFCLGYFHSQEVLDWIEENICEPITESWGYLAAASNIDWTRVESWFSQGRPLSFVAIDALAAIVRPMSPFLRDYGPSLREPPFFPTFRDVLVAYRECDPVPRVQQRIDALLMNANVIVKSDP